VKIIGKEKAVFHGIVMFSPTGSLSSCFERPKKWQFTSANVFQNQYYRLKWLNADEIIEEKQIEKRLKLFTKPLG